MFEHGHGASPPNGSSSTHEEPFLPDVIGPGLQVLFVGFNPSTRAALLGHHYAGRGNQFWRLLGAAGLTPRTFRPDEDRQVVEYGLGLTNLVARPTRTAANLTRAELQAGAPHIARIVAVHQPIVIAYTGKGVYTAAAAVAQAPWGAQPGSLFGGPVDYVLPSPSGLARMPFEQKLSWYRGLRQLLLARGQEIGQQGA
ncbi:mismatch-specific DNA-glycosylase [Microvirga roseola]|uniref:mismatch-specific DNA-glycosylase n=1 Tax=Microvirga roseola TaxID=2883126 RepID=UPI001E3D3791|nr:mismatch-specific DNA-glycosylase [Microvirga roseola]